MSHFMPFSMMLQRFLLVTTSAATTTRKRKDCIPNHVAEEKSGEREIKGNDVCSFSTLFISLTDSRDTGPPNSFPSHAFSCQLQETESLCTVVSATNQLKLLSMFLREEKRRGAGCLIERRQEIWFDDCSCTACEFEGIVSFRETRESQGYYWRTDDNPLFVPHKHPYQSLPHFSLERQLIKSLRDYRVVCFGLHKKITGMKGVMISLISQ